MPNCPICLEEFDKKDMVCINECEHLFCAECLEEHFKSLIKDIKNYPFTCPFSEKKLTCRTLIEPQIVLNLIKNQNQIEKYFQNSLKRFFDEYPEEMSWCPSATCSYGFQLQELKCTRFECPLCKKVYCLKCRVEYHEGKTCEEYNLNRDDNDEEDKEDDTFLDFVKNLNMKQCPKCKFWVQKKDGCNHIICKCGNNFCYQCGKSIEGNSLNHNCEFNYHPNNPNQNIYFQMIDEVYENLNRSYPKKYQYKSSKPKYVKTSSYKPKVEIPFVDKIKVPLKSDGTPDMRYAVNNEIFSGDDKVKIPLKNDGTPDMRYAINNEIFNPFDDKIKSVLKSDGTPDMRYAINQNLKNVKLGTLAKDGTLDMRFKENKYLYEEPIKNSGKSAKSNLPTKKDGTLDMRFKACKDVAKKSGNKKK